MNFLSIFAHQAGYSIAMSSESCGNSDLISNTIYKFINQNTNIFSQITEGCTQSEKFNVHLIGVLIEFLVVVLFFLHKKTLWLGMVFFANFIRNSIIIEWGLQFDFLSETVIIVVLFLAAIMFKQEVIDKWQEE